MLATPSAATRSRASIDIATLTSSDTHGFEQKLDGIRVWVRYDGGTTPMTITGRNGTDLSDKFPELGFGPEGGATNDPWGQPWPKGPFWFDGEIVSDEGFQVANTRSKAPVNRAHQGARDHPCRFVAFDVPAYASLPYTARRQILFTELAPENIVLDASDDVTPMDFIERLRADGAEGVIAKRFTSLYEFGARSKSWVKFKNLHRITCIGVGYNAGTGAREEFGALNLALFNNDHSAVINIGTVGTGFSDKDLVEMKTLLDAGKHPIVEIECLNITNPGRQLRFPVYRGIRADVTIADCVESQLDTIPTC